MAFPPDSITMEGIIVSTSMKFWARARKPECHRNTKKLCFDILGATAILFILRPER